MKRPQHIIYISIFLSLLTIESAIAKDIMSVSSKFSKSCENIMGKTASTKNIGKSLPESSAGAKNISWQNFAKPSLWWATEQFDPFGGRLVENWLADSQVQQINLVVNWQLWTLLDYLGRYRFVNQFGTVARKYGYSLNIFNQKKQCLATYKYNPLSNPPKWEINLEKLGRNSLQVEPSQFLNN